MVRQHEPWPRIAPFFYGWIFNHGP
jgi:hypothetical protein